MREDSLEVELEDDIKETAYAVRMLGTEKITPHVNLEHKK